jgi:basic membrane protein A
MDEQQPNWCTADMKKRVEATKICIVSGKIKVADYMADNACRGTKSNGARKGLKMPFRT